MDGLNVGIGFTTRDDLVTDADHDALHTSRGVLTSSVVWLKESPVYALSTDSVFGLVLFLVAIGLLLDSRLKDSSSFIRGTLISG